MWKVACSARVAAIRSADEKLDLFPCRFESGGRDFFLLKYFQIASPKE